MAVKITIEGDGLSLNKQTTLQKAGQIISFLGLEEGVFNPGSASLAPKILSNPSISSPKDAISDSKAKTNAQKITVLVNFLSETNGEEGVLVKEILLQLRKIGEQPANFNRDLGTAESLQYLYPLDAKKKIYGITDRGKGAIASNFENETPVKTQKSAKGVFKKAMPPSQEVLSLPIASNLEGFPDYHSLSTKADSILWALAYADAKNISDLTSREVESITDRLKNKVAQRDFSAHNKKNMKSGYIILTDGKFKIQQKGINYLKSLLNKSENGKEEQK